MGDDRFWAGIRTYYKRYMNGHASTADFRAVMEEGCIAAARVERIDMTSGSATATFKADAEPTSVVLDPNVKLLAATEIERR